MAVFTTEEKVRQKFQLEEAVLAPESLVLSSMEDAHEEILRWLDPAVETSPPPVALVLGETLLAGARLLGSLASKDAAQQKDITVGGQRIAAGKRFASLTVLSEKVERQAWEMLEPYLLSRTPALPMRLTDTTPVLGEE